MSRILAYFWVYVLPFPVLAMMFFIWLRWSGSREFALFVFLLPVIYGYVVPGIATNIMGKWRFKGPWVIGSFYLHHGFKYASSMMPLLFLPFLGTAPESLSAPTVLRILLCTAALHGYVLWLHDILILRCGMVEIYKPHVAKGSSPEEIAMRYAPACFFTIGLTYAASALLAFRVIVLDGDTRPGTFLWLLLAGMALMMSVPSVVYHFAERPWKTDKDQLVE